MIDIGTPRRLTETGFVTTPTGRMLGFYVSKVGGTMQLKETEGKEADLTAMFAPTGGWHWFPIACGYRFHVAIEGELDVTFSVA